MTMAVEETVFGLRHRATGALVRLDIRAEDHGDEGTVAVNRLSLNGELPFEVGHAEDAARAVVNLLYERDRAITSETVEVVRLDRVVTIAPAGVAIPIQVRMTDLWDARYEGQAAVAMSVANRPGLVPGVLVAADMTVRRILTVGDVQDGQVTLVCSSAC